MEEIPETQFAQLGDDLIAYQVLGAGPVDLVYVPSLGDCIDLRWEYAPYARFLRKLASFSRLIMFDRCGTGASDPAPTNELPSWERWADEALAVMDAVGSVRAAVFGIGDLGPTAMLFAALRPDRTEALVLGHTAARFLRDGDYPGLHRDGGRLLESFIRATGPTELAKGAQLVQTRWADLGRDEQGDPSAEWRDPSFRRWHAITNRLSMPPRELRAHLAFLRDADVRDVLPAIRVPTLVLHRTGMPWLRVEHARYLAEHIPTARLVELRGGNTSVFTEPHDDLVSEIAEFLTGHRPEPVGDRSLAAVLFTDVVGSTEHAVRLGDERWRALIDGHDAVARTLVEQHRGRLVRTTGDGVLALFDGPGRAIACAQALRESLRPLGLQIRAGLHTGEVEIRGEDVGGVGVHIAARVMEKAGADELLTSPAVPLLVAGSSIEFEDRGEHELRGVPGTWRLHAVRS